ncbi:MAG: PAS domain S-box protein [Deltaproteobacteria bacterium]|nr:PAS domain S-box protein [Deltaproteobacteria bacterium]
MKILRSSSLLHKALFATAVIIIPIIITFTFSYDKNKEHLKKNILDDLTVMAEAYEGHVYQFLESSRQRANDFASDGHIREELKKIAGGDMGRAAGLSAYILKNKKPLDRTIGRVSVITLDGRVVSSTDPGQVGRNVSDEPFFRIGKDRTYAGEDTRGSRDPGIAISTPVTDKTTGKTIGVLANFTDLSNLNFILSGEFNKSLGAISWSKGKRKTMEVYLVNKDRLMLTQSIFIRDSILNTQVNSFPVNECLASKKEIADFYKDYRGVEVAGASMCIPDIKWTLLVEVDSEEVLAPIKDMYRDAVMGGAVVAGLIGALFFAFYKVVIRRLRVISAATASIAGGNYDISVPIESSDEIGALSEAFNGMSREIRDRNALLIRSEERLKAIIDNSTAVIFLKDAATGRYLLINRRFEELFNINKGDIIGKTDYDIFSKELADAFRANDLKVVSARAPLEFDEKALHQDGILHDYISIKVPIFDPGNVPFAVCGISTDITERKQMEESLKKSEEKYRTLVSNIPDVTWTANSDGKITFISNNVEEVFGYSALEICADAGDIWTESIHPADIEHVRDSYIALFSDNRKFDEEYRVKRRDGEWIWVNDRATATYGKDGVRYADGVFSDITGRRLAEEKIERLSRLYAVLSKVNEAIVRIRDTAKLCGEVCRIAVDDGKFLMAWIGRVDEETSTVKPFARYGEASDYLDRMEIGIKDDSSGRGPTGTAIREGRCVICNDIGADAAMAPWRDEALRRGFRSSAAFPIKFKWQAAGAINFYSGEPEYFTKEEMDLLASLAADISYAVESIETEEQVRVADEARRELQHRYEELANNLTVGIYRTTEGSEGHFIEVNRALVEMFEAESKEKVLKQKVSDFYANSTKRAEISEKIVRNGFIKGEEIEFRTAKGKKIWGSITAVMKLDKNGTVFFDGIIEDITERKKLEDQFRHSQKMEAVGQLAGGIAHDFNNILTALIGYGNLLLIKKGNDALVRSYADHMLTLSEKAASLTQGLLTFSRKQIMETQPVDINDLVKRVEKILRRLIGEDIELECLLSKEPLIVKADAIQIEHVLMNLATNARDAMPGSGKLTIQTCQADIQRDFVEAHGYGAPGIHACISFSDTGSGIDAETQKRIFEPFFTTKEVGKGTGLGLSMVYGIIKQHNGFIDVHSEPGSGTTFKIYLPVTPETIGQAELPKPLVRGGDETVLLAEDEEDVRMITKTMLQEFGYKVIAAVNGEDAILKYAENKDAIKLLVLDMVMPKKNGNEVYEEIKKQNPAIKALFTSGYASDIIREKGMKGEMNFISKPVSPSEFLKKIREVIER